MEALSYNPEKELNDHPKSIGLEQMEIISKKWRALYAKLHVQKEVLVQDFFVKYLFQINSIYYHYLLQIIMYWINQV